MAEEEGSPVRRRRVRSWAIAVVVLLVLAGAVVFGLPLLARPALERELRALLQVPVAIGALSWNPLRGSISAADVVIGGDQERITAKRLSVGADLAALLRGEIAVDRIEVDEPSAEIRLDENFRPILGSLFGRAASEAESRPPPVSIARLEVRDGKLRVHYPLAESRSRDTVFDIRRLTADDVDLFVATGGVTVRAGASFEGALDGAPLRGEAQILITGDDSQAGVEVSVSGMAVSRDVLPLPAAMQTFDGKLEGRAKYLFSGKPARQELDLELRVADARLGTGSDLELGARTVTLPKVRVDLLQRRVDLGAVTVDSPTAKVNIAEDIAPPGGAAAPAWDVTSAAIQLDGGALILRRGERSAAISLASAHWDGLKGDRPGAFTARMNVDGGGSVAVDGSLAAAPLSAKLEVHLDELPLPLLAPVVADLPLGIARGTLGGVVSLEYGDGLRQLTGTLEAQHVHSAPPDASRPAEVLAVHSAAIEFTSSPATPFLLDIASLRLSYPYAMLERQPDGLFPLSLFDVSPERKATQDSARKDGSARILVRHAEVEGGKLEFVDDTLQPFFWTSLTDVSARAEEIRIPEATIGGFEISGKQDEISPARIAGAITGRGLEGRAELTDVRLESLNGYVAPLLGYEITAGGLSSTATAAPAPPLLESTVDVVLRGVDVQQTGRDIIQEQSGVPLPIALGLIADATGEIRLTLPLFVDPQARSIELGSIVWQAVRSAIIGALTSPLRLLGSLFGTRGAPHAFAVDPIPFAAGSESLDRAGERRVEQIARILQSHRSLALVLLPQITDADVHDVGIGGAAALAGKRNATVRDALTAARIDADRLMLAEWQPKVGADATGKPGVYVELQEKP